MGRIADARMSRINGHIRASAMRLDVDAIMHFKK
jgi:hypothetical protein